MKCGKITKRIPNRLISNFKKVDEILIKMADIDEKETDVKKQEELEQKLAAEDENLVENTSSVQSRQRGRPFVPKQWSKVISLDLDNLTALRTYDLATDLLVASALPGVDQGRRNKTWLPVFSSETFTREHDDISLENYRLRPRKLKRLGIEVSKIRTEQR